MRFRLVIDPTQEEEIVATVHRPSDLTKQIEALVQSHSGADKLAAYQDETLRLLSFSQIACITVIDGKTYAVDQKGGQYRLKQRLYELETLLPHYFIRINKSALANENLIDRFHAGYNGAVDVIFKSGYREYVSRRCFATIKRRYHL